MYMRGARHTRYVDARHTRYVDAEAQDTLHMYMLVRRKTSCTSSHVLVTVRIIVVLHSTQVGARVSISACV